MDATPMRVSQRAHRNVDAALAASPRGRDVEHRTNVAGHKGRSTVGA
jgi:hypothetical protein